MASPTVPQRSNRRAIANSTSSIDSSSRDSSPLGSPSPALPVAQLEYIPDRLLVEDAPSSHPQVDHLPSSPPRIEDPPSSPRQVEDPLSSSPFISYQHVEGPFPFPQDSLHSISISPPRSRFEPERIATSVPYLEERIRELEEQMEAIIREMREQIIDQQETIGQQRGTIKHQEDMIHHQREMIVDHKETIQLLDQRLRVLYGDHWLIWATSPEPSTQSQ